MRKTMMSLNSNLQNSAKRLARLFLTIASAFILLILSIYLLPNPTPPVLASHLPDYETRKAQILISATQEFINEPVYITTPTALDLQPFDKIINLDCTEAKPINNPSGWSVEMRTGGRPFLQFDDIEINGTPWVFEMSKRCTPGTSGITQTIINDHYAVGKTVNRMRFLHWDGSTYPTVVVMTPDGFFNVAGAQSPMLQGAATRIGFTGEPFDDVKDYIQHADEVSIFEVDNDTLYIVYNIHSEAGEGVLELELKWDADNKQPELYFRSAHVTRSNLQENVNQLGFVGFNFMKGPTLSGLITQTQTISGIEAFHDGRTIFSVHANGSIIRNLLISPIMTDTIVREDIVANIIPGSKIVLDQPQDVTKYFSKFPDPGYERRTDLILKLTASSVEPIDLKRAQKSVDLTDVNPEANETVNVFYATEMAKDQLYEFSYILSVASEDFEQLYSARRQGVVFVSNRLESWSRLYHLPLDSTLSPIGTPTPLTDIVISDPHHPSASADGQFINFDADDYELSTRQRIYTLNLNSGAVRRLTLDPFGASTDEKSSLSGDGSQFSMITNRHGTPTRFNIQGVAAGLSGGVGNQIITASGADWCHVRNEIVYIDNSGLHIYDVDTMNHTSVITMSGIQKPRFSPSCDQVAYVNSLELWVVNNDGSDNNPVLSNADHPTWVDEDHLIFQRAIDSNTDIYLLTISTITTNSLTSNVATDSEPAYVKAVSPTVVLESPTDSSSQPCNVVGVSGFVASAGIPVVTVNSIPAAVKGDQWFVIMNLDLGVNTLTVQVTDSSTGLTNQDEIGITVSAYCTFLPIIFKNP